MVDSPTIYYKVNKLKKHYESFLFPVGTEQKIFDEMVIELLEDISKKLMEKDEYTV